MNYKIIFIVGLSLISFIGCSSSEMMMSNSFEKEIVVDGNHEDWSGKLKYFEDERAAIGFQNDSENLFFCFVTSYKSNAMKIMSLGLTVWFEPESSKQKIGLQYPKRIDKALPKTLMGKNKKQNEGTDFETTIKTMIQNQGEFSLVDEKSRIIYASPIGSNDEYDLKIGSINQQFVYEAKIPIANNSKAQMPIDIFSNEKINIQFETGEFNLEEMKQNAGTQQRGAGLADGGQGNSRHNGSGMQGGMGGARPGSKRMKTERFTLEIDLKLAK